MNECRPVDGQSGRQAGGQGSAGTTSTGGDGVEVDKERTEPAWLRVRVRVRVHLCARAPSRWHGLDVAITVDGPGIMVHLWTNGQR